jgi:hypothetical protein
VRAGSSATTSRKVARTRSTSASALPLSGPFSRSATSGAKSGQSRL